MAQLLREIQPHIKEFRGAAGYYIKKGVYPRYPEGRPYDAFIYVVEGAQRIDFGDFSFVIKTGDLAYIAKGASFTLTVSEERCGLLQFDFILALPPDTRIQSEVVTPPGGRNIEYIFRSCITVRQMLSPNKKIDSLAALYSIYSEFLNAGQGGYLPSQKKKRMEEAAEYIDAHIADETLGVQQIADALNISESHLRHSFKETHNMAISEYIHKKRIRLAKNLLQHSTDSMTDIAAEVGFSSIYYFSSAFKKEVKCSPSEYRKRRQM